MTRQEVIGVIIASIGLSIVLIGIVGACAPARPSAPISYDVPTSYASGSWTDWGNGLKSREVSHNTTCYTLNNYQLRCIVNQ